MTFTLATGDTATREEEPIASPLSRQLLRSLRERFCEAVAVWSPVAETWIARPESFSFGEEVWSELVAAAKSADPQFLAEQDAWGILVLPFRLDNDQSAVAVAPFLFERWNETELQRAARTWGIREETLRSWSETQPLWRPEIALRFAAAVQAMLAAELRAAKADREVELVSENLATTYEEISLLYTVTKNLKISSTDEELGQLAIERLEECLPASSFAIHYLPIAAQEDSTTKSRTAALYLTSDDCPLDESRFVQLIEHLHLQPASGAVVVGKRVTTAEEWPFPDVRQLIVVPLVEGDNLFGWLAAINHRHGGSFGTIESNLLGSLGTLLGIHCGNRDLYRQQSELLKNIVRALVSAIDAKDPYTSGHSDRVARIAVRIALEMRCSPKFINTIYMAGLLHDVGKIGIDDNVLRKAGRLTDLEFEHIKRHPELGFKILADLKPLADVLPAVLHHHEQWDGAGYPQGLSGDEIPQIARIMSVADAYDAMTSDRPYRIGLPEERVEAIFREGCGKYWDPAVVDAFFAASADIHAIADRQRAHVDSFQSFQQQLV